MQNPGRHELDAWLETSGVTLDLVHVGTIRDGRATFLRVFRSRAEALEAVGLSR